MTVARTKTDLAKHITALRRRVGQGDLSAMCELGQWLQDGSQDRKGRSLLRSNPAYAFRLLKTSGEGGCKEAAAALGYFYDIGLGTKRNKRQAIRWYLEDFRNGGTTGAANLATVYRDAGDLRRAFGWWKRAAALSDGDSVVDAGYCYQYGIGVRKDVVTARRMYRKAIKSRSISEWGREEALYSLAVSYLDARKPKLAAPLLKRAAKDEDYPEAAAVLMQIRKKEAIEACRCRRFIREELRGHAKCPIHAGKGKR